MLTAILQARKAIGKMDAVCVEVNLSELYRGASEIEAIEARLTKAARKRVAFASPRNHAFGDALYRRA